MIMNGVHVEMWKMLEVACFTICLNKLTKVALLQVNACCASCIWL